MAGFSGTAGNRNLMGKVIVKSLILGFIKGEELMMMGDRSSAGPTAVEKREDGRTT